MSAPSRREPNERSKTNRPQSRMTLRSITKDNLGRVEEIREQEIPATSHDVGLWLRRAPFRDQIAEALLKYGTITLERKEGR